MIKEKLEEIMRQTFYDCKSSNSEVAAKASYINTLAHQRCKEVDRLIINSKKNMKNEKESKMYKPVDKGSLY